MSWCCKLVSACERCSFSKDIELILCADKRKAFEYYTKCCLCIFFSGWIETAWGRGHMMNEPSLSSPPSLFPQVSFWPRFTWRLMKLFFGLVQTKIYWNVQQFWFVVGFDKVGWLAMYMNAALWFIESRWRGDQWITNIWNLTNAFFMADFSFFLISFHKGEILIHRKGYLSYRALDVLKALVKGMDINFHSHWLCFFVFPLFY